jgi:hypothetical protein
MLTIAALGYLFWRLSALDQIDNAGNVVYRGNTQWQW